MYWLLALLRCTRLQLPLCLLLLPSRWHLCNAHALDEQVAAAAAHEGRAGGLWRRQ